MNAVNSQHLERQGSIFQTNSDTEVLAHLVKRSSGSRPSDRVKSIVDVKVLCVVLLTDDGLMVAHNPNGLRPLSLGKLGMRGL